MKNGVCFHFLWQKLRRRVPALLLMTAAHVGSAVLGVLSALGTKQVINSAVQGDEPLFFRACLVQGGIVLGILICLTIYRYLHEKLMVTLDRDWKLELFHGLLHGDYAAVSAYHSGELINRLNNDVRTVNDGILTVLPGFASLCARLAAILAVLFALEPRFTLLLAFLGLFVVAVTGIIRKHLRLLHKQVSTAEGQVSGFFQEALEKLVLIQAMSVEGEVERRVDVKLENRFVLQAKRRAYALTANSFVSVLGYGSAFVTLVWCAWRIVQGTMSLGDLTAMTQLVSQLQSPFVNLSSFMPKYVAMMASCERLMELDFELPEVETECAQKLYEDLREICAENITFSYGRDMVLENGSFRLPKGSFAVVTGPSGAGKSTLLKLMLGIFSPDSGTLTLDCGNCRIPLDRRTRSLFAYVPQGNLLFSGTLRDNLLLTNPDASEKQIEEAVYVSCLDRVVMQLPNGLETVLGENSNGLSEGQAQRLSLARAVLSGAPVLLLDEVTSALDAETEMVVLRRIKELPGRTCIAVTHRSAAMELADWQLQVNETGIHSVEIKTNEFSANAVSALTCCNSSA